MRIAKGKKKSDGDKENISRGRGGYESDTGGRGRVKKSHRGGGHRKNDRRYAAGCVTEAEDEGSDADVETSKLERLKRKTFKNQNRLNSNKGGV